MASNTPNLELLKKDPTTDGADTFNIKIMLNDNWDKIDAAMLKNAQDHPHRNLLDNWDFRNPINQRGETSYQLTTTMFAIDRWQARNPTGVVSAITINEGYITFEKLSGTDAATHVQEIENLSLLRGHVVTLSVESDGVIYAKSFTVASSGLFDSPDIVFPNGWRSDIYLTADNTTYRSVRFWCGTQNVQLNISRVKLELGSVSTLANDPPADYGKELRRCQRYYYKSELWHYLCLRGSSQTTSIVFPVTMRKVPSIKLISGINIDQLTVSATADGIMAYKNGDTSTELGIYVFEAIADL